MEKLTKEQIYGLVKRKFSQTKAAVLQGGEKLSVAQKKVWAEAQIYFEYQAEKEKEERRKNKPDISNNRVDKFRKKEREVELLSVENEARRRRLEKDTPAWLRWYLNNAFPYPFSTSHIDLIEGIEWAARTGEGFADAEPRGQGKSTTARGVTVKLVSTGIVRFPVLVNWKHSDAKDALGLWLKTLCDNPRFAADYPEICAPFIRSTHATALKNLTWAHNGNKCGAMLDTLNKVITLPDSRGAIAARSAQGDAKGLNAMMPDGTILRPDFVLFDDAQNPDAAANPKAVRATIDKLENIFLGMAGPQKRLCSALVGTVEHEDDVIDYFLKRNGWRHNKVSRIIKWPDGSHGGTWDASDGCESRILWDQWREIYDGDGGQKKANRFFRKNKKKMTGKMEVNWKHRFDKTKDVSAIDAAMHDWFALGEDVFARGQQNHPLVKGVDVYHLTPDIIASRTTDREPYARPEWAELIVCGTDINPSYALTTAVIAFGRDRTAAVIWYGKYDGAPLPTKKEMSETQKEQIIYGALCRHGEQLLMHPNHAPQWIIDGGGAQSNVAKKFSFEWNRKHPEMSVIVAYGRAGKSARVSARNETIRKRGADGSWILCRDRDAQYGWTEWLLWNADQWREIMQRAWTCDTGAPGGATLPNGHHREYCEHLCREKLKGKIELNGRMIYDFEKSAGMNDYADATNMCYVLADVNGIGSGGVKPQKKLAHAVIYRPSANKGR